MPLGLHACLCSGALGAWPRPRVPEHQNLGGGAVGTAEARGRSAGLLRGLLRGRLQRLGALQPQAYRLQQVRPPMPPPPAPE